MSTEQIREARWTADQPEITESLPREFADEVADFCSLLSVASRVLITSLGCRSGLALRLGSKLANLPYVVKILAAPLEFAIDRSDTVIIVAGPELDNDEIRLVEAVIDSDAVLLSITAPGPPVPLDRADATISVRPTTGRNRRDGWPASTDRLPFELTVIPVADFVHTRLTELLRNRGLLPRGG